MKLYEKSNWINPNISFLSNQPIVEYDMKDAGLSLIKKYKLLPKEKIKEIDQLGRSNTEINKKERKKKQNVIIGIIQRDDKELANKMKMCFEMERMSFIERNSLTEDQIISIKKDAFFLLADHPIIMKIDDYVTFRKKNEYSSYLFIKPLEIYYSKDHGLDVKGMSDEKYNLHRDYMGSVIYRLLSMNESSSGEGIFYNFRNFIDRYKSYSLESDYYREFNPLSNFLYMDGELSNSHYRLDNRELNIMTNLKFLTTMITYIITNTKYNRK